MGYGFTQWARTYLNQASGKWTTLKVAIIADGFFTATTAALAKFADGFWAATDGARAKFADGIFNAQKLGLKVRNESGGAFASGDLVCTSGWSETHTRHLVVLADADAVRTGAAWILRAALANNANDLAFKQHRLTGLNTDALNVGDPIYVTGTATTGNTYTGVAPTGAAVRQQIVGRVAVKSATVGEIEFDLTAMGLPVLWGNLDLEVGVLSADANGRALMANTFFDAATVDTKVAVGGIGEDRLTANEVHGRVVSNGAEVASGAIPVTALVIPMILALTFPDQATGFIDYTGLPFKCRVIDAWSVQKAAGNVANTFQVQTAGGAGNITDAFASAGGDRDIGRAGEIEDANHEVAAAGTIRVANVRIGGSTAAIVYLKLLRVP